MELWVGALNLGFLYALMTMGVFITYRIHDFPDITVDGSFAAGAAMAAVLIVSGHNPFVALLAAGLLGAAAGCATAVIHTRFGINGLLAGILVMTGMYSVNLHVMGRSNIPLLNQTTFLTYLENINPGLPTEIWTCIALCACLLVFWILMSLFFKTDFGISMRVTGNNPVMAAATGVNVNWMKIFGVTLANGLVGISGGLVAQYQGFADVGMGIGTIVIGLAAVIIGESILRKSSMFVKTLSVIVGSVVFRMMIAVALYAGMNPIDLKLLTALFVLITLVVSKTVTGGDLSKARLPLLSYLLSHKRLQIVTGIVVLLAILGIFTYRNRPSPVTPIASKIYKIGVFQISDNGLLNVTRDSFLEEMKKIGYQDGKNCTFLVENANNDLPTANTIADKFLSEKVDIVVPISTACTQVAINKIKDRPVVFATVANPFKVDAGKSDTDHLPNVTGVYGSVPMDKTMEMVRKIMPQPLKIGCIWDQAHANSVFNVEQLQKVVATYSDVTFLGATITGSSEVYEAALSLVQKGIDAFVLAPDNIVYSAFESVVKAAIPKKIPIFLSDVERLGDGALVALGYDYTQSGIQAAHLVDRILKGESPKGIPFEHYSKLTIGLNLRVAKEIGVEFPAEVLSQATILIKAQEVSTERTAKIGIVQFGMEPTVELCKKGILKALEDNGYSDGKNIEIVYKNAQADFSMINAIIQDLIRREVDIIVPLSTPCVQAAVQLASGREKPIVVFTYIFDPYRVGAAKSETDHLPNMTGVSCFPPIEGILDLIAEMFPDRKKVGIPWNSSEANSEVVLARARDHAAKIGLEIIEASITNPSEIMDAARSLTAKGADVLLNPGDNTLDVGFSTLIKVGDEKSIPVFSVSSEHAELGALAVLGPDYHQTGYDGGSYLAKVLGGQNPASLPIYQTKETLLCINMDVARKLNITVNSSVLERAQKVIDSRKNATVMPRSTKEKTRVVLVYFCETPITMDTLRGVHDELKESGAMERYNIALDEKSAQGDMSMATLIANDIVRRQYDYIITLSTPILQVMAQENLSIPHVFGMVTDPFRMGVAKSPEDHLPQLTGVATLQPVGRTIKVMRELLPNAKRIGIVWNTAEACSEACTYKARESAPQYGFELLEANVSSAGEVLDAAKSLIARGIDIFILSGDNTVGLATRSLAELMKRHKIPFFTNGPGDVELGAFLGLGADYYQVGRETVRVALRVMAGENPKDIPINACVPETMAVSLPLADLYGIHLSDEFLSRTAVVKRE
ncbi:MAG TPA: ABC transporter substrate binding protein [bacterium]|nr:ABC transporter substrate binding protein [bacterium]HQP98950.1 ABC transporter substrate binding protein [bacterium]